MTVQKYPISDLGIIIIVVLLVILFLIEMTWVELSVNSNYEMLTEFPYYVRNKRTKRTLTPQVNRTLYSYRLQNKRYYKHMLVYQYRLSIDPEYQRLIENNANIAEIERYKKRLLKATRDELRVEIIDDSDSDDSDSDDY